MIKSRSYHEAVFRKKKSSKPVKRREINEKETREKFVNDAISDNAEELCRQLQDRLEGLTKIGGKLEKQNKGKLEPSTFLASYFLNVM